MMTDKLMPKVIEKLDEILRLVKEADKEVLNIYKSNDLDIKIKKDKTAVTNADIIAHKILTDGLRNLFPSIPIVSEEGDEEQNRRTIRSEYFWLIDPIDGTNEFISKTDQFTVCIGLIENNIPSFGIVSAPALGVTYYGGHNFGSYKLAGLDKTQLHVPLNKVGIVTSSRSKINKRTKKYIDEHYPKAKILTVGSQLKFTYVAEGKVDAYPRLGSSMSLWDIAAGQAILEGAGGSVKRPDGSLVNYHSEDLLAGDFIASI